MSHRLRGQQYRAMTTRSNHGTASCHSYSCTTIERFKIGVWGYASPSSELHNDAGRLDFLVVIMKPKRHMSVL
jgi:hypothetical protein